MQNHMTKARCVTPTGRFSTTMKLRKPECSLSIETAGRKKEVILPRHLRRTFHERQHAKM